MAEYRRGPIIAGQAHLATALALVEQFTVELRQTALLAGAGHFEKSHLKLTEAIMAADSLSNVMVAIAKAYEQAVVPVGDDWHGGT